jgi:hypothetical protein
MVHPWLTWWNRLHFKQFITSLRLGRLEPHSKLGSTATSATFYTLKLSSIPFEYKDKIWKNKGTNKVPFLFHLT